VNRHTAAQKQRRVRVSKTVQRQPSNTGLADDRLESIVRLRVGPTRVPSAYVNKAK
jgi:hypothetical protein